VAGSSSASVAIQVNPIQYTLTMCVEGSGSTTPAPGGHQVEENTDVPVSAVPDAGNQFEHWVVRSGPAVIANPSLASTTVRLSGNAEVCAGFHPDPVIMNVVHSGSGSTTPDGNASVIPGRATDISAVPDSGWNFFSWTVVSGDAVIANPSLASTQATMTVASTVQANFISQSAVTGSRKLAISGELVDDFGNPVGYPDPEDIDVSIRLTDDAAAGNVVYTEVFLRENGQAVTVNDGLFVARLGEGATTDDLQQVITANPQLWVEITIEDESPDVLLPRTPLTASAYSLGGTPAYAPAAPQVLYGSVDPEALGGEYAIGTWYVNGKEGTTWLRIHEKWKLIE
jgi:hypothetical protein